MSRIIRKNLEKGSVRDCYRTGRPRKSTSREDKMLRRAVMKNPFITSHELKAEFPDIQLSARGIRHRLAKDLKLPAYKP